MKRGPRPSSGAAPDPARAPRPDASGRGRRAGAPAPRRRRSAAGSRRATAPLVVAALALAVVPVAHAAGGQRLDVTAGLTTAYDSNLLQYSDTQLDQFENGAHPDRFSLETRDDLVWSPALALAWQLDSGGGRRHLVRLRGTGDFHRRNGTADFRAASLSWHESFGGARRLALGVYLLPHYYLRQLLAEDEVPPFPGLSRYRRAEFGLGIAAASWTERVAHDIQIELGYQFERRRYDAAFRERDSDTHQGGLAVSWTRRHHSLEGRFQFRAEGARAEDGDETAGNTDDADVGYRGPGGTVTGRADLARRGPWRLSADLALEMEARDFVSGRPRDTYHRGRADRRAAVEAGVRAQLRRRVSARGFWRYETNDARLGAPAPASADAGSYHQQVVGLALDVAAALWRSPSSRETETEP